MNFESMPPRPEHLTVHRDEDLIIARIRGAYDADAARHLEFHYLQLADRYGYRRGIFLAREMTTVTAEARRLITEWNAARPDPTAIAVVGASFTTKTVAKMLLRAVKVLTTMPAALDFFDTEAEARSWLDRQREIFKKLRR